MFQCIAAYALEFLFQCAICKDVTVVIRRV